MFVIETLRAEEDIRPSEAMPNPYMPLPYPNLGSL